MTTKHIGTLGALLLGAVVLLAVPGAMAGDQLRDRVQDQIKDHDQLHDCQITLSVNGGDHLRTRDRLRDESCLLESQAASQDMNTIQWRHWNRYMLNGDTPPSSQGFALLPLWLYGF